MSKTVSAGVVLGTAAGVVAAVLVMRFVPEFGHSLSLMRLSHDLGWAVVFSFPIGPLAGAFTGAFLSWRARGDVSFRRLVAETVGLAVGGVVIASQLLIPVAWDLPRLRISVIIGVCAAGAATLSAWMLKSLYWSPGTNLALNKDRIVGG